MYIWEGRVRSDTSEFEVDDKEVLADARRRWPEKFSKTILQKLNTRL